nr:synapsin-3-like [Cherax quadricarinatus]
MGVQQTSPSSATSQRSSPPPLGSSKCRRPTTLTVGAASGPTKTSPTSKAPTSPSSGKPSPTRSPTPKSGGSPGKVPAPASKPTTCPQGPVLATEARSKVRPCGCSRRHSGSGHHHPSPPPETPKNCSQGRARSKSPSKPGGATSLELVTSTGSHLSTLRRKSPLHSQALPIKTGNNRYVSTLVWVPRMQPRKFSTTIIVSTEEPIFTDAIYIKSTPCPKSRNTLDEARKH